MVARGRVQGGVVVLLESVRLPEGQSVLVVPDQAAEAAASGLPSCHSVCDIRPLKLGRMLSLNNGDDDLLGEMLEGRQ